MALAVDLMGVGLPQEQATRLGLSDLTTIVAAGTTQGAGTLIPASVTNASLTTAGGATAVRLSGDAELTQPYYVRNASSTSALVFPPTSGIINNQSVNTSYTVAEGQTAIFTRVSLTRWSAFSTSEPNILATANVWTAQQLFRATTPAFLQTQGAPTAKTVTSAITAAELLTSIITTTGVTAPSVHQLPTGTLLAAALPGIAVGDSFDWSLINTGTGASDDATITVNSDHTIVGNPTVGALTDGTIVSGSGRFRTRYTATNTFVTYRIA